MREKVMAHFKVKSQHLLGKCEENHGIPQSGLLVFMLRNEHRTS
jgi:hypothetical protein